MADGTQVVGASGGDAIAETEGRALENVAVNAGRTYYDVAGDTEARSRYYANLDLGLDPSELFATLSTLLEATHTTRPPYAPSVELYPWVDLHPDGQLRNIYSGTPVSAVELIHADAEIARQRADRLHGAIASNAALGPREFEATFDGLEQELPFNCEHVVPQSWFGKHEPMRGDLHHLFACEPHCNSARGNTPYADLSDSDIPLAKCGRLEEAVGFEPLAGKGPVARATLYFLVRYPGQIGDEARELQRGVMPTLLQWHHQNPVEDYERHRNAAISEVQGNRNPLVDAPDVADRVDFTAGFG